MALEDTHQLPLSLVCPTCGVVFMAIQMMPGACTFRTTKPIVPCHEKLEVQVAGEDRFTRAARFLCGEKGRGDIGRLSHFVHEHQNSTYEVTIIWEKP